MKIIINAYFNYLKGKILSGSQFGPLEKNKIIENMLFIKQIYKEGIISGSYCLTMLYNTAL